MRLPPDRGPWSAAVVSALAMPPHEIDRPTTGDEAAGPPAGEDAGLALWILQELSYRGFDEVDERWEWNASAVSLRVELEKDLEARLRARWPGCSTSGDPVADLTTLIDAHSGPSLAGHLVRSGSTDEALDMLRQRSVYHLKEADPTAWVVPRLAAETKAALVEIEFDEYGAGDPARLHHRLFERGMTAVGLRPDYGAYVATALPEVLEQNTALTMLGLHRRLRGACLGHFAAFEATSSAPSRQLAQALRKLGLPEAMAAYYDEHVEADAVHEQLAIRDVCGSLVAAEPHLTEDVLFGAWTYLDLETRAASAMLERWGAA